MHSAPENPELAEILREGGGRRALVLVEQAVAAAWPELAAEIEAYFGNLDVEFRGIQVLPGGEPVKADDSWVRETWKLIDAAHLDRHSYLLAIGGGAFLDAVGFAAATAHRGVRLVRFPTTTLAQDDSGVGVKCAINAFGKKNWIGAFAVPFAVINDFRFLHSQDEETRRAGLIEAVKVALVKDAGFFEWIEENLAASGRVSSPLCWRSVWRNPRCCMPATSPGEGIRSRRDRAGPLDFGHWAAHKLEALTSYQLVARAGGGHRVGAGHSVFDAGRSGSGLAGGAGVPGAGRLETGHSIIRRSIGWMNPAGGACWTGWMNSANIWVAS